MESRPLALVTGASAGIGTELCRVIAADGHDLLLVARREDRLHALAAELPGETYVFPADLADRGAATAVIAEAARIGRPIDVLVNNAGFGHADPFVDTPLDRMLGMVDLNVRAVVELTHRLLPKMIERRRGGILNVASTAAFLPGPHNAIYYASKAFVLSFSEALWEECRGTGVTVSALCPGPTATEFGAVSGMSRYRLFRAIARASAADVAAVGWRGYKSGRRVVIEGGRNRFGVAACKALPHRFLLPIVKRVQTE